VILPDANLLLYAYDTDSRFHQVAARWWEDCLSGSEAVALCPVVLFAFVRVGTSARAFERPLTIDEAATHVRSWLDRSITELVVSEEQDLRTALEWLQAAGVGGNLTTDAQIAAIASRLRAVVHTADTDFQRFPGVRWHNPLL
jgi:uncharacterized protein